MSTLWLTLVSSCLPACRRVVSCSQLAHGFRAQNTCSVAHLVMLSVFCLWTAPRVRTSSNLCQLYMDILTHSSANPHEAACEDMCSMSVLAVLCVHIT
jgi:hypothetical protein